MACRILLKRRLVRIGSALRSGQPGSRAGCCCQHGESGEDGAVAIDDDSEGEECVDRGVKFVCANRSGGGGGGRSLCGVSNCGRGNSLGSSGMSMPKA